MTTAKAPTAPTPYPGASWKEETAPVSLVALEEEGKLAAGMADGSVNFRLLDKPETKLVGAKVHNGGLCAMTLTPANDAVITAGEDGKLVRMGAGGMMTELADFSKAWVEHLAVHPAGPMAVAFKKTVVLLDAEGKVQAEWPDHPSSVGGLAFDPKGKRLAVSHYGGITLWWVGGGQSQKPERRNWKGSHLQIGYAPSGKYLLTCLQENALHGWRLPDFADFAMSGYARKPKSFQWNSDGHWLASSGSPGVVCWDCSGKGPMGKPATVLGEANEEVTVRVAFHPELDMVAAGTEKGSVYLARFQDRNIVNMKTHSQSEITALSWSASGNKLLAGAEDGTCYAWSFTSP
jgi:WD40 repeat protein